MSYAAHSPAPYPTAKDQNNPLGVVSLVLGLVGIFTGCPFSVAAIITGWIGMKREPSGMARAGFIMGLIVTILQTVIVLAMLAFFVLFGGLFGLALWSAEAHQSHEAQYGAPAPAPPWETMESVDDMMPPVESAAPPNGMPAPGFPPGAYPPGMAPPYVPPGAMPPGAYPPGAFPPGMGMPPGVYPPGGYPPGMLPSGGYPPGAYPPGAFPPGAFPGAPTDPSTEDPNASSEPDLGSGPIELDEEAPMDDADLDADAEGNVP